MRAWIWLSVALLALAGCADDGDSDATDDTTDDTTTTLTPPDAIHEEGSLIGIGDSLAGTGGTQCNLQDQSCVEYTFTLEDTWTATITLVSIDGDVTGITGQVLSGTDYDLFLFDDAGNPLGESTQPGEQDDVITKKLDAGTYTVQVMAWNDQDGSYTLDIEFS